MSLDKSVELKILQDEIYIYCLIIEEYEKKLIDLREKVKKLKG